MFKKESDACFGSLGNVFVCQICKYGMSNCCLSRESAVSQILSCINVNIMFGKTGSKQSLYIFQLWS